MRIRHREYIRDIVAVGPNFAATSIVINPGFRTTFPWLSSTALAYESYLFNSLSFEFESSGVTTDRGTVMIAIDFDASDSPPLDKQELLTMEGATRSSVWSHQTCTASQKNLKKFGVQRFIRNEEPLGTGDIKTYDVGKLLVATHGTGNLTCGELYVSYDITLHTPQPAGVNLLYGLCAKVTGSTGVAVGTPLGTGFTSNLGGLPISWRSNNSFYVNQVGSYLLNISYEGSDFQSTDLVALVAVGGATEQNVNFSWPCSAAGVLMISLYHITVTTVGAYFQISMSGCLPTSYVLRFTPWSPSLGS